MNRKSIGRGLALLLLSLSAAGWPVEAQEPEGLASENAQAREAGQPVGMVANPDSAFTEPSPASPASSLPGQGAQLHALALALKAEMAKTTASMLSVPVVRNAEQIERLAQAMSVGRPTPVVSSKKERR